MNRIATLALALLVALSACADPEGTQAPPPRIFVLITVDTLRADRLGAYGSPLDLTPRLDALARESEVFTSAWAPAPFTLASIAALLTGRYPETLGIASNASALPPAVPTLAGELRAAGWRTAAVVSNLVLRRGSGLDAGFDVYDDTLLQRESVRDWPERIAADTTDAALATLDDLLRRPGARVFLWVHYQDPHGPYTPPEGRRERYLEVERRAPDGRRELPIRPGRASLGALPSYQRIGDEREVAFYRAGYDAEVGYTDEEIGRLLDGLESRGIGDETLLAFTADHGESLGEGDYWFAHGELLTDALVRVPLLIRRPGGEVRERRDPVSLVDLFPTLLRAVGLADPPGGGRDLLAPRAAEGGSRPYLATLGAARTARHGLVEGDSKLVLSHRNGVWQSELFHAGDDEVDHAADEPERAAAMRRSLEALRRGLRSRGERRQELDARDLEHLRALGYVTFPEAREPSEAREP